MNERTKNLLRNNVPYPIKLGKKLFLERRKNDA